MTLSEFIVANTDEILREWDEFAKTIPAARGLDATALRDHAAGILKRIALDMEADQSNAEQKAKSRGDAQAEPTETAAQQHATHRGSDGFTLAAMVSEYRALRATVVRVWMRKVEAVGRDQLDELVRFDEGIDQALAESVERFMQELDGSRELFLGVLGHDLRNPLSAILNSAGYLMMADQLSGGQAKAVSAIFNGARRSEKIIGDLLDVARTRLGQSLPVAPAECDLASVCANIVQELQAFNPERTIESKAHGDLRGHWDEGRMGQLVANLAGNAVQHSSPDGVVSITAADDGESVRLQVHNHGNPIPKEDQARIFEPLARSPGAGAARGQPASLGLGLYIARQIVQAHGGRIAVESSAEAGTTFVVTLPRQGPATRAQPSSGDQRPTV